MYDQKIMIEASFFLPRDYYIDAAKSIVKKQYMPFEIKTEDQALYVLIAELGRTGWNIVFDNTGITSIYYSTEGTFSNDTDVLSNIAKFVRKGSYILMGYGPYKMWKYYFNGVQFKIIYPRIVWPEET